MPKISKMYLEIDPFKIVEKGFHKDRSQVSESIFSLYGFSQFTLIFKFPVKH